MLSSEIANIQRATATITAAMGTLTVRKLRTMVRLPPIRVKTACRTTASANPASESTSHIGQPHDQAQHVNKHSAHRRKLECAVGGLRDQPQRLKVVEAVALLVCTDRLAACEDLLARD